jgi:hypothetical protein
MKQKTPKVLDEFVDKVLRYKPPPKSKAAKKRAAKVVGIPLEQRKRAAD